MEEQGGAQIEHNASGFSLQSFKLYETRSDFYMIGTDETEALYRVLKIDRSNPSELSLTEDSNTYSSSEHEDLLNCILEKNKLTGGLNFIRECYGIIGFIKFLGPYYMLLITERKQIGTIVGHAVYQVTKTEMIPLPCRSMPSDLYNSKDEGRYKQVLSTIDLTKDFYYSYSYGVNRSLQKNLCDALFAERGQMSALDDTMFIWNYYLTRGVCNHLRNSLWTVDLVYGFFKQDRLTISGKYFLLTLIARRSRYYAGTRYLKRGVNEKGRVANDVETEQIVSEDVPNPTQISSVVQHRGSIPLFWSQETSKLNPKPDIKLHSNYNYEATKLHFDNLAKRYGNPIVILNLIKKRERKPRESLLRKEFIKAISTINRSLSAENHLKFLHWDLHMNSQSKAINVLIRLVEVATHALKLTGYFYCQVTPDVGPDSLLNWSAHLKNYIFDDNSNSNSDNTEYADTLGDMSQEDVSGSSDSTGSGGKDEIVQEKDEIGDAIISEAKPPKLQRGVLRTNCIDCLDRTNVAQYAYGLSSLWHQLHSLGLVDVPEVDLDAPLAHILMQLYENMGDTLARQYGGSAAHNKIFSERRGHLKFVIRAQEFFRTLQRHYSNAYMDANKQAAINLFLGYFQPQQDRPAIWDLEAERVLAEHAHVGDGNQSLTIRRALSDGNILHRNNNTKVPSLDETSTATISCSICTPTEPVTQIMRGLGDETCEECKDSNFLDVSWLYEEVLPRRSSGKSSPGVNSPASNVSAMDVPDGTNTDISQNGNGNNISIEGQNPAKTQFVFSEKFVQWVESDEFFIE